MTGSSATSAPLGIVANRRDAALHAFAIMIRTLTEASRNETGRASEALLEAAEALGKLGRGVAQDIAAMDYRSKE